MDAAVALSACFHAVQAQRGVGVEELEIGARRSLDLFSDGIGAGGILGKSKPSRLRHVFYDFRGQLAVIGGGTFVDPKGDPFGGR